MKILNTEGTPNEMFSEKLTMEKTQEVYGISIMKN